MNWNPDINLRPLARFLFKWIKRGVALVKHFFAELPNSDSYLRRWERRRRTAELKDCAIFGLVAGALLMGIGVFRVYFDVRYDPAAWHWMITLGKIFLLLAVVLPDALRPMRAAMMMLGNVIGKTVMAFLLSLVYVFVVTPTGLIVRARRGSAPWFQWSEAQPAPQISNWEPLATAKNARAVATPLLLQPLLIMIYFLRNGRFFLLPAVIVLLCLGLVLFFVHSSALAPFIYTLF